jgi:hypothetical protein
MTRTPFTVITDHPLPTSETATEELWNANPQLSHQFDKPPHPDILHEKYVVTVAEAHPWELFRITLYGYGQTLYVWNSLGGYGLKLSTLETDLEALTELVDALSDAQS